MNRCHRIAARPASRPPRSAFGTLAVKGAALVVMWAAWGATPPVSFGQPAPAPAAAPAPGGTAGAAAPADLPPRIESLKPSSLRSDFTNAAKATVDQFVASNVPYLLRATDERMSKARDTLAKEAAPGVTPNAAFGDYYSQSLAAALAPAVKDPSLRVRLNIAIVLAKVAGHTQSAALAPVISTLLDDPSDAVCMWALKAAAKVLPNALAAGGASANLVKKIAPAAQAHNFNGMVTDAAYEALQCGPGAVSTPGPTVIPSVLELYKQRVALYRAAIPDVPQADARASSTLIKPDTWTTLTSQQQASMMKMMLDLLDAAAAQSSMGSAGIGEERWAQLIETIQLTGEAISVVGKDDPNIVLAGTDLRKIGVTWTAQTIQTRVKALQGAVKSSSAIKIAAQ